VRKTETKKADHSGKIWACVRNARRKGGTRCQTEENEEALVTKRSSATVANGAVGNHVQTAGEKNVEAETARNAVYETREASFGARCKRARARTQMWKNVRAREGAAKETVNCSG